MYLLLYAVFLWSILLILIPPPGIILNNSAVKFKISATPGETKQKKKTNKKPALSFAVAEMFYLFHILFTLKNKR